MDSGLDAANLKQNQKREAWNIYQRVSRLLREAFKQNNLSDWFHCLKCGSKGHTARFCAGEKGNLGTTTGEGDNHVFVQVNVTHPYQIPQISINVCIQNRNISMQNASSRTVEIYRLYNCTDKNYKEQEELLCFAMFELLCFEMFCHVCKSDVNKF